MSEIDFEELEQKKETIGKEMYNLISELYPICRSITGEGVRKTDEIISKIIPLEIKEVPSGTQVFDWRIPKEWNIVDAYILNPKGEKIIDFKKSNLHVLNYSIPIKKKIMLDELKKHIFTLPNQPDLIPYRTSYYKENWGFCMSHKQYLDLKNGEYEVQVNSSLKDGSLTYGEYFLQGKNDMEIVISCYTCHPSMCNDNLSGIAICAFLAKYLSKKSLNYSYRFLFIPETIGAIAWLALNEQKISKIKHGFVVTCAGDSGKLTYKKSLQGNAEIDKVATYVLRNSGADHKIIDFFPPGSDERQFSSPAFRIPVGLLMRSSYDDFPEYHTSGDNLDFVNTESLSDSFSKYLSILYTLDNNKTYQSLNPKCEPQLGKRGLYSEVGAQKNSYMDEYSIIAVLSLADGNHTLLDIAERTGTDFKMVKKAADKLYQNNILEEKS